MTLQQTLELLEKYEDTEVANIKVIKELVNVLFDDFEAEKKQAYIDGSNANYKAMKESGMIK